ncbi:prepilin peptidase [Streptomyces sp. SS7]|uniref:prepilin peptidase n=1 Tax=Streptomyces sp. SS7 TaxID=3108485 RepID=UPI0030EE8992
MTLPTPLAVTFPTTAPPGTLTLVVVAALWGALAGAFLPRPAYRLSVPVERADQGWYDTCPEGHPVRGWLGRGGCRGCTPPGASYAPGALLLPTVTAVLCAALAAATGTRPELAVWLLLAPAGVLLAVVDVRVQRLPDPLTLPLAATALALLGVTAVLPEHAGRWTTALLGSLALAAGHLLLHLINPAGLAFGDVKLALATGAVLGWYGWPTLMLGTLAAFVLGALYGLALAVAGRATRRTTVPFGPFMLTGAFTGVLIGAYAA